MSRCNWRWWWWSCCPLETDPSVKLVLQTEKPYFSAIILLHTYKSGRFRWCWSYRRKVWSCHHCWWWWWWFCQCNWVGFYMKVIQNNATYCMNCPQRSMMHKQMEHYCHHKSNRMCNLDHLPLKSSFLSVRLCKELSNTYVLTLHTHICQDKILWLLNFSEHCH